MESLFESINNKKTFEEPKFLNESSIMEKIKFFNEADDLGDMKLDLGTEGLGNEETDTSTTTTDDSETNTTEPSNSNDSTEDGTIDDNGTTDSAESDNVTSNASVNDMPTDEPNVEPTENAVDEKTAKEEQNKKIVLFRNYRDISLSVERLSDRVSYFRTQNSVESNISVTIDFIEDKLYTLTNGINEVINRKFEYMEYENLKTLFIHVKTEIDLLIKLFTKISSTKQ